MLSLAEKMGIHLGEEMTTLTYDLGKQTSLYTKTRGVMVINVRKVVWVQVIKNLTSRSKNSCSVLYPSENNVLMWKLGKKLKKLKKWTFQWALLKSPCSPRDTGE